MHLNDLINKLEQDGPFEWVSPEMIEDFDFVKLKAKNELKWFQKSNPSEDIESPDEIITDYLCECLLERKFLIDNGRSLPLVLDIDAFMLVEAAIYLICKLGSSYAGTHLAGWRDLLTSNKASGCLDLLAKAYTNSNSFVRDILRDFILELFRYGPLWTPSKGAFFNSLNDEQNSFLRLALLNGYITINNKDSRYFIDGSMRV
ncbi:hypothetical protein [Zooshikella harenae]|uniref:Uncharacterized protein n=1 Tax=Zooshikella harenae TaxID=2827238 RepID=A0ABS5ZJZ9_9GAMM|nr:hypothetical protein [Zooshikella harenae]MBU2714347.1 hypothetical protein [Zooshikella harenae]